MTMMDGQTSDTVLLCRPAGFGFNSEAAASNAFAAETEAKHDVAALAFAEFEGLRSVLESAGITCLILDEAAGAPCPDAVFPNNWVSFHGEGTMVLYPMAHISRRRERQPEAVKQLVSDHGLSLERTVDLSPLEHQGCYLEGTGSLVLDRPSRMAFASRSGRTNDKAVEAFDRALGYRTHLFDAADRQGRAIYHTNVLLSLGRRFAVICAEAVAPADRQRIGDAIAAEGRTIIDVSFGQMERFACNLIELKASNDDPLVAMSRTALDSFEPDQRRQLEKLGGALVAADIPTIEAVGGGSVRCMIADVHLPKAR